MSVRYASDVERSGGVLPLDGRRVPGVREHRAHLSVTLTPEPAWLRAEVTGASDAHVSDATDATSPGYVVIDVRAGLRLDAPASLQLSPFAAVTNVLDRAYDASLIVNDSFGRFYEPAAGRAFTVGVSAML